MTTRPSKEERDRIRAEWKATQASKPPAAASRQYSSDEPLVLVNARGDATATKPTADERAARKAARRKEHAPLPALDLSPGLDSSYGQFSVQQTQYSSAGGDPQGNFVDAAIKAGWIKPR